ncbi:hypothetical protein FQN54_007582 [Arachnomyces sp. PD_36]|nr:hypothetical protein FQN54_007582 [Arachnomyces sp. PD_36]
MGDSYHSLYYPSDPGSPDSTSPIPDEYVNRNKGEVEQEHSLLAGSSKPDTEMASTYNEASPNPQSPFLNAKSTPQVPQQESTTATHSTSLEQQHPTGLAQPRARPTSQSQAPTPLISLSHPRSHPPEYSRRTVESIRNTPSQHQLPRGSSKQNMAPSPESRSQSSSDNSNKPSVKHLTCWWWYEKGQCRYRESDCLYAHHDTGLVADAPRQIKPGEPALAGRSLDRALRQVQQESVQVERGAVVSELPTPTGENTQTPTKPTSEEEIRLIRLAYETLLGATFHSLETTTRFRQAVSKLSHELQSAERTSYAAVTDAANTAHSRAVDSLLSADLPSTAKGGRPIAGSRAGNMVSIQELASTMRIIEQKALESGAAEWNTRAKISSIENMLGEAGLEDLVQSARKLAQQQK